MTIRHHYCSIPEPVVIAPVPVGVVRQPVYLRVKPGHAKDWRKHCRKYDACGQPVYFVQDDWYSTVYVPQYREHEKKGKKQKNKKYKDKQDKKND